MWHDTLPGYKRNGAARLCHSDIGKTILIKQSLNGSHNLGCMMLWPYHYLPDRCHRAAFFHI
jgi:hypothetical protein